MLLLCVLLLMLLLLTLGGQFEFGPSCDDIARLVAHGSARTTATEGVVFGSFALKFVFLMLSLGILQKKKQK